MRRILSQRLNLHIINKIGSYNSPKEEDIRRKGRLAVKELDKYVFWHAGCNCCEKCFVHGKNYMKISSRLISGIMLGEDDEFVRYWCYECKKCVSIWDIKNSLKQAMWLFLILFIINLSLFPRILDGTINLCDNLYVFGFLFNLFWEKFVYVG